jgi:osmotically inducible protein OsmC
MKEMQPQYGKDPLKRTGKLTTQSNTLANTQYSFKSRFEDGWVLIRRTNCSSTFWLFLQCNFQHLLKKVYSESIETKCEINLVDGV